MNARRILSPGETLDVRLGSSAARIVVDVAAAIVGAVVSLMKSRREVFRLAITHPPVASFVGIQNSSAVARRCKGYYYPRARQVCNANSFKGARMIRASLLAIALLSLPPISDASIRAANNDKIIGRWDMTVDDNNGGHYPSWFEVTRAGRKL